MNLDKVLADVQQSVPECVAVGLVELNSGMLMGIRTVDSHPQEIIDLVAAATGDLFQGRNVVTIEQLFRKSRGLPPNDTHHYFREIISISDNLIHVFMRCKSTSEMVLCFVCRVSANLGMVLTKARMGMPKVEAAL